jgi:hypothetical protein
VKLSNQLNQLKDKLQNLSIDLAQKAGVRQRIEKQCLDLKAKIEADIEECKNKKEGHLLLLSFISQRRESGIASIEKTATYALRSICGDDYTVHFLRNEEKKSSAAFKMEIGIESNYQGQKVITGLKDSRGGGVTESTSFGLRLAALEWLDYDGPALLDEAFKSVSSDEKIHNVGKLLNSYASNKNRQLIFATHKADVFEEFADNIINVTKEDGISQIV